jgi:hypothetical protein
MATSGKSARIGFESHLCHEGLFPDRNALLAQPRTCVCTKVSSSGDRDELLPHLTKQARKTCRREKMLRDGGVASKHKVPRLHFLRTRLGSSLEYASFAIEKNLAGGAENSYFAYDAEGRRFEPCHGCKSV